MKLHLLVAVFACLAVFISFSVNAAEPEKQADEKPITSKDEAIGYVLQAIAEMSLERAEEMLSLQFTRDLRENLCGFKAYDATHDTDASKDTYQLFRESCEVVKYQIEKDVFSEQLVEAFKRDLITNMLIILRYQNQLKVNREAFNDWLFSDVGLQANQNFELIHKTRTIILMVWDKRSNEEILSEFFSLFPDLDSYQAGVLHLAHMALFLENKKKKEVIIPSSINVTASSGTVTLSYVTTKLDDETTLTKSYSWQHPNATAADAVLFRNLLRLYYEKENKRPYIKKIIEFIIKKQNAGFTCSLQCKAALNMLLAENPYELFQAVVKAARLDGVEGDDYDDNDKRRKFVRAINTIETIASLSKVQDVESAKGLLMKYQSDVNTRTSQYHQWSFSLGTIIGMGAGNSPDCHGNDACEDLTLPPNIYFPFGLLITKSWFGFQFHFFDLGQYTSYVDKNEESQVDDPDWQDAIAPGIAIFGRTRRYPFVFGIDYTMNPAKTAEGKDYFINEYKAFLGIEVPLFTL